MGRGRGRGAPLAPGVFDKMIASKTFTNGADANKVATRKYLQTFEAVIANAIALGVKGLGLSTEDAQGIAALALAHCRSGALKSLDLGDNLSVTLPL